MWNRDDYADYRLHVPRFVAESGWQAPPAYATLRRALPGEELAADSPGMLHHQKAEDGNGKLERGLARHFPVPQGDFDRWHYLMQVNQARAVATGIEHWRSHWPVYAGTVVWQLNDCWPVTSWAAIDGDGRPKPLYHELKRLYADRLRAVHFPVPDREVPYPRPEFDVTVTPGAVTVTARTLVRYLLLSADRLAPEARADTGLVTLLPGERVTIGVRGWKNPEAEAARSALYRVEPTR